jgi:hypothetical protein
MRRKRRALLQTPGLFATAAASTQGENRARRSSLHGNRVLIVHTRSHRRKRERERGPMFFFGKQIGKIFRKFLFSSLNATNFARFLENSPNFRYEKIEKKEPCSSQGFFSWLKLASWRFFFSKWLKVFIEGFYCPQILKKNLIEESPYFSSEC